MQQNFFDYTYFFLSTVEEYSAQQQGNKDPVEFHNFQEDLFEAEEKKVEVDSIGKYIFFFLNIKKNFSHKRKTHFSQKIV